MNGVNCPSRRLINPSHFSCVPRKHLAHYCLAGMVVSGNADKYEKLRTAYNSVLDDAGPMAPPFEEYRGMSSICGNVMCKWVLRLKGVIIMWSLLLDFAWSLGGVRAWAGVYGGRSSLGCRENSPCGSSGVVRRYRVSESL